MHAYTGAMKRHTTIDLDQELVREAAEALGTKRISETIHAALDDVVRRHRRLRLLDIPIDLDLETLRAMRAPRHELDPDELLDGLVTPEDR